MKNVFNVESQNIFCRLQAFWLFIKSLVVDGPGVNGCILKLRLHCIYIFIHSPPIIKTYKYKKQEQHVHATRKRACCSNINQHK